MNDEPMKHHISPAMSPDEVQEKLQKFMQQALDSAYEAGYKRGWRDACAAAAKALEPLATADVHSDAAARVQVTVTKVPEGEAVSAPMQRGAIPEIVFQMIGEKPGMTGVQIVAYAKERGTPLHERSIRTALRRLRLAGRIHTLGGRWYVPGREPPGLRKKIAEAINGLDDVPQEDG